jgi:hypothetical protein
VIDLGLRLEDALRMNLPTEEFTRRKELPRGLRLNEAEKEYFRGRCAGPKSWVCRRVEFTALRLLYKMDRMLAGRQAASPSPVAIDTGGA